MRTAFTIAIVTVLAATASGADTTVGGESLVLRASARDPERRAAAIRLRAPTITGPFADPRVDGAVLVLHAGVAREQCFVAVPLPPDGWRPAGGAGARRGWRYRDPRGRAKGIRRVVVRPGRITVVAAGPSWPCGATVAARLPVSVTVGLGSRRWCAAFGGEVTANRPGLLRARAAPPPPSCPDADVTVANLNVLHGFSCPAGTDNCRFPERAALLLRWIEAAGCPDVVTLQEVRAAQLSALRAALGSVCAGSYQAVYDPTDRLDDAVVLTRVPAFDLEVAPLAGNFRTVLRTRLDHPAGPVEVFTTHLAASSDGARLPCATDCPAECVAAGAATRRECQGVQVARLVETRADQAALVVMAGDLNEPPGSFVHRQFTGRGWIDSHLAAGNAECQPATGLGCTSGREDGALDELESPAVNEVERVDFLFVAPRAGCRVEAAGDPDRDGTSTGLFADRPNPFSPVCGAAPAPICWPSDHVGAQLDLECG